MGDTGRYIRRRAKKHQCICAFALTLALVLLVSCPVSADSQVDSDLVFENLEAQSTHIVRRHAPNRSNSHHRADSSQHLEDLEDDDHWASKNLHRIKRQISDLFGWFTTPETPTETTEPEESNIVPDINVEHQAYTSFDMPDDEDLNGHGGSGEEGSGVDSIPTYTYYRLSFTASEYYVPAFSSHDSEEFVNLENPLVDAVEQLYEDLPGRQTANIVNIEPVKTDPFQIKITMDLSSKDYNNKKRLEQTLLQRIKDHRRLGDITVSPEGFIFSAFDGSRVPVCEPEEFPCRDGTCVSFNARCNGAYECSDRSDEDGCPTKAPVETETTPPITASPTTTSTTTTTTTTSAPVTTAVPVPTAPPVVEITEIDTEAPVTHSERRLVYSAPAAIPTPSIHSPNVVTDATTVPNRHDQHITEQTERRNECRGDDTFSCHDGIQIICSDQQCDGSRDCDDGSDELHCACAYNEFSCDLNRCIQASQRCDGIKDCDDGTDELHCRKDDETGARCAPNEFRCEDGSCIDNNLTCDGQAHCHNGEDERDCFPAECKNDEFACKDGQCISELKRCDETNDCQDGSDEADCDAECEHKCPDGVCARLCDGFVDCHDGSDEVDCGTCKDEEFMCASGDCIPKSLRCNQVTDCPYDGSDEDNCAERCTEDQFDCGNGQCIDRDFMCDGFADCANQHDEQDCKCDLTTHFDCGGNACIPQSLKCNGIPDCADGRDEFAELCKSTISCAPSDFRCGDGACIPESNFCDGTPQCADRSDEEKCGCNSDEYPCANGDCIPYHQRCDGYQHCRDASDELNCPTPAPQPQPETCQPGYELCRSGDQCYPRERACDDYPDCRDHSDELNCPSSPHPPPVYPQQLNLKTYPTAQDIKERREVVFQCRDEGPLRASVRWSRGNGLPLPPGSRDNNGRLEIPNIQLDHSGTYICSARGFPSHTPGAEVTVHLNVERHVELTPRPPKACQLNEATCANGDCIPKNLVCNGRFDCSDGSDETRCSPHGCEPNEFRCANKRCVLKTWVCDSDDDCGDGSDEIDCGTNPPGSQCSNKQFRCHSGNQCIPKSFHCDSENDCVDRSDEIGCSPVTILRPPPPMIELEVTNIFEITCTAVGVPTPEIVWRLNWGHIPEKCKTTSINGTGVLTCPDIQVEDSGAYSCEAINIRGSVLAVPDTILVVIGDKGVCPQGQFNDEARSVEECIQCFCFGVTDRCKSADLYTYQLQPPFDAHKVIGVNVNPNGYVDVKDMTSSPRIHVAPTLSRFGVKVQSPAEAGSSYIPYFVMPENYNSNQLKSYGGYLKYNIQHRGYGAPLSYAPDVIISGNGYTLLHHGRQPQTDRPESVAVRFFVGEWIKRSETGVEQPATREEIMMALASVDSILIKLQYVQNTIDTTLDAVEMDSAAARNTGLGLAVYVEECTCPIGYTGYSCENCAPGYVRHRSGPWLGQCYKEERCPHGTYGDLSRGIPCRPCPCPHTSPPNQFTQTCSLDHEGSAVCSCPPGYTGKRCEQCDSGYTGNPLITGDYCKPTVDTCDSRGSTSAVRDHYGQCQCKELTYGRNCDQCKANTYHLSGDNLFGCIACFCMGVTQSCKSSDYYRDSISTVFASSRQDFKVITAEDLDNPTDQGIRLDTNRREIVFENFTSRSPDVKYWSLPSRFLGDKITSYGGNLRYTVRYTPIPGGSSSRNTAPDVELISRNHIRLSHYRMGYLEPNSPHPITVPLLEQFWQRNDGQQADREHLLMALADVQAILIKATYTTNSQEVALSSVSLDIAEGRNTGNPLRAYEVEQCDCPPGYVGLSCQDCDYGYKRASSGLYLGLCIKCDCGGWSNECDAETGYCLNCQGHRTGPFCDKCMHGFELNALNHCVRTPGTDCICDPRGSLGTHCYGGACQCKTNVEGQTCNRCKPGTFGLNANVTEGCQSCFCSGVSTECAESNLYIEQIPSEIYTDARNFTLTDQYSRTRASSGFQTNTALNELGYFFRPSETERLWWSLPRRFTGHRITSYGGKLEFTQRYTQRPSARYSPDQDIIISGNGITIYWSNEKHQQPDIANRISVTLSPATNWHRQDMRQGPRPASREDIMRVLANVDSILIRAQLSSDTASSFISDITLDTAVRHSTSNKAVNVEVCRCPLGYKGTSCELCDAGFYRDTNDFSAGPFGSCTRCSCSGHETSCELSNNRILCHCQPGYSGHDCSQVTVPPTDAPVTEPQPEPLTIEINIVEPELQIVEAGSDVQFHCEARSTTSNAVSITWTKDGGPLPDRAISDTHGLLVITDLRISDSGRYICEASDSISIVTQHITLTVGGNEPVHPRATIYPNYVEVSQGESFDLRCEGEGNPTPDIHWERQDRAPFNPQHSILGGVLRIVQAVSSDSGRYICRATNIAGVSTAFVEVVVRYTPHQVIEPRITPDYFSGEPGSSFVLRCETNEDYTSIRWEKQNGYLPYDHTEDHGILTVRDARPEDSGTYVCTITTASGQSGSKTAIISIDTTVPGDVPTIRITPKNQTVGQGATVELYCDATGVPAPTIKWTRVHEDFGPNTRQSGPVLRIQPVNIEDRGIYVCVASNSHGIAEESSLLLVERREKPEVDIYPGVTQTVNEGTEIQIICRITAGIPSPILTWSRRDGRPISPHMLQGTDLIRISPVRREDDGEYICTAANELGSATASTTVVVTIPPRITLSHSSPYVVTEREYVRLECRAEGHPLPTVQWRKHISGQAVEPVLRGGVPTSSAILEIASAQISDEGIYICHASNPGGSRQEYLELRVDSLPNRGDITGEDSESDKEIYPTRPDVKDNERIPNVFDERMTAPVGTRAELRCRVEKHHDRAPIQTKWVRQDNVSLPSNSQAYGSTLYIDNVQPSDGGNYLCLGIDPYGIARFTVTVNLVVTTPPRVTLVPSRQVVRPYDNAVIECTASGDQPIDIQWHAVGREMPSSVIVDRGFLEFRGIQVSDAGKYRCTASNNAGNADSVAEVLVDEKSQTWTLSSDKTLQTALPGSSVTLRCVAAHSQSHDSIHWYREHLQLPQSAQIDGQYLRISNLQHADAGRYYCEVRVRGGGTVSDYVDLEIESPPPCGYAWRCGSGECIPESRRCDRRVDCADVSDELHCRYRRADHAPYEPRESQPPHEPQAPEAPELTITASAPDAKYGDYLDLHCRSNEQGVVVTWTKANDRLADNVQIHGGYLRFVSLRTDNNGVYRCETRGQSGYYYKDYVVDVIDTVQQEPTAPPLDVQYAPQGESIYMECKTDLEEPVTYEWSKQGGELGHDVNPYVKRLRINDLTSDDAGTYVCSASNGRQTVTTPTVLVVTGIVPFFTQAPNSYLALPTIPDHFARFSLEISFKPESDYGLILYNGNNKQDFVSLALSGGHVEFKFNLGHDTTTLVSPEPVQVGKWHTVKVRRERKTGIMYVDGKGPVTETGKGKYSGLVLTDSLYLGGVSNYHNLPADIDIKSGFVGCISQLKVGHNYYDLLREAITKTGTTTCETCQESPCQNQGVCQESLSKEGFTCICTDGFSGPTCNKMASQSCTPYTCGDGRCVDNEYGYECHCPIGKVGTHCEREVAVVEPAFTKNAYVAYPPLRTQRRLKINLKIKPKDVSDGILMYSAQDAEGHGNFVSLAIKDRRVEFRYDAGNGPVVIRSDKDLVPDEYVTVSAMKSSSEGRLMVTGSNAATERSMRSTPTLSLHTPLFLGGVNKGEVSVSPGVGVETGFDGCIATFDIFGVDLKLIESATGSSNVLDCSSLNPENNDLSNDIRSDRNNQQYSHEPTDACSRNPCWNHGQCIPLSSTEYRCRCRSGFSGHDCEITSNTCEQLRPCENGGTCEPTAGGYHCNCPIEFRGTNCETAQHIGSEVHFEGNGYLEFDRSLLPHSSENEEVIALQLSTNTSNGLIFWQGQTPNEDGRDRDNIGLAVVDGYLLFTFSAGSGPVDILHDHIRVDDGKVHTVVLKRRANYGSIEIDNEYLEKGEGIHIRGIEVYGNLYLGGTPNNSLMTGKFNQGFVGCIHAFEVQDSHTIELGSKAISGINVKPCSSSYDSEIVN